MQYPRKFPKGMLISGLAATSSWDSSGELLDVEGADISSFYDQKGYLNYEHKNGTGNDIVGKILYAKKLLKRSDCEDDDQRKFWNSVELPSIYIIGVLFDADEEHPHEGARAVAAIINYCIKNKEPMILSLSIEGSTLERQGNILKRTMCRGAAITIKPANHSAIMSVYEQKLIPKEEESVSTNIKSLIKPKYLSKVEQSFIPFTPPDPVESLRNAIALAKAIEAGSGNAAPGALVQGAALQGSEIQKKLAVAYRAWNKKDPLKKFLKSKLPEASDDYLDRFIALTDELRLKKSLQLYKTLKLKKSVFVTPLTKSENESDHELALSQLASHLGLGQHFPERTIFRDAESGQSYKITGKCYGRFPQVPLTDHDQDSLLPLLLDGTLDKLAVLDKILDIRRNVSNFILSDNSPHLKLTDSEIGSGFEMPDYLNAHAPKHQSHNISLRPLHPEAMFMIESLNENRVGDILRQNGVDESEIKKAQDRIAQVKQLVNARKDLLLRDALTFDKEVL
jgi:hypothetical protein